MSSSFRLLVLLVAPLVLGAATPVRSQGLAAGTRVRVTAGDTQTVGVVARSAPDSLVLALPDGAEAALPWAAVARVEHSAGRQGRPGRGALIGAAAMATLSAVDLASRRDEDGVDGSLTDAIAVVAIPFSAAVGAGLGALVGLAVRTDRWVTLPIGPASAAGRPGPGVTVALRF